MQDPEALGRSGPLLDESGGRRFEITLRRRLTGDSFIASVSGVETRDQAELIANLSLFIDRTRLPPPAEDEFYYSDLIGLSVEDLSGRLIGTVASVLDYGAGSILEVARAEGGELLLPFTRRIVGSVDLSGRRLVVDPPTETS
jgi:16S rRNA processing protein RimM